jgi:hypothetical protein
MPSPIRRAKRLLLIFGKKRRSRHYESNACFAAKSAKTVGQSTPALSRVADRLTEDGDSLRRQSCSKFGHIILAANPL